MSIFKAKDYIEPEWKQTKQIRNAKQSDNIIKNIMNLFKVKKENKTIKIQQLEMFRLFLKSKKKIIENW